MLKKEKENSGLLALGAGQLAKCKDRVETVTCCCLSALCGSEEGTLSWSGEKEQ